ncbi:glucosamine--fructose-6-phosphate aminotransferase [isomerizing] [Clostridium sp. CAG:609]|nr:glucosamine--fructose-6-phosphate aminotransferase [isomerizing] [Clostridium sp. CAG:609]
MCGIIGYIGTKKCVPKLINALEALEYRGYDSAGIAYVKNNTVEIIKEVGKIKNLKEQVNMDVDAYMGIGHTRWATHGEVNKINAHPHKVGQITLIHNGIIENYQDIKNRVVKEGYKFKSKTDSEIAAALIDSLYKKNNDMVKTLNEASKILRGSYAFVVMVDKDEHIYATRNAIPMIAAIADDGNYVASDVPAILAYTKKYMLLNDLDIVKLSKDKIEIFDKNLNKCEKEIKVFEGTMDAATKNGYEHFMLKEINEQDKVFKDTINYYYDGSMESLEKNFGFIKKFKKIDIVACGSAYHTGIVGKSLIEKYADIPVNVEVASEYRYKKCFYDKDTLLIVVSQSGETADTLAALRKAKNDGITTMAIVNVIGSSIAREADHVVYIKAGFEIAVATTKAYLAQVAIFSLIALYLGKAKNIISDEKYKKISDEIKEMPKLIQKTIKNDNYIEIADKIYNKKQIFFIGRAIDYAIALEASLKLKEISYINSVAYQAGELKHGTISLIAKNTPVIALLTDEEIAEKTISNIKETKARGAYVILVTNMIPNEKFYDKIITIDKIEEILQPILTIIPLQLLSYRIAKNKGCDIDKPRNLAKSVTVE